MKDLYRQTFDRIRLSEEQVRTMRTVLTSRSSQSETEAHEMKKETQNTKPFLRRTGTLLVAALLICTLSVSALAYGGVQIYQMLTGGMIEQGETEDGAYVSGVSIGNEIEPVEVIDGRLILTINGENKDITDQCSYTQPYIYECVAEDGLRHSFIIGGNLDAIGWAEFIWDEDNMPKGGAAAFGTPDGTDDAPWFAAGKEQLNLPW